jgi:hypothetical protein
LNFFVLGIKGQGFFIGFLPVDDFPQRPFGGSQGDINFRIVGLEFLGMLNFQFGLVVQALIDERLSKFQMIKPLAIGQSCGKGLGVFFPGFVEGARFQINQA